MAGKHELIQDAVVRRWSVDKRGRLFHMRQGTAVPINGEHPIDFGPLKGFKGFSDAFGWEFVDGIPVFCLVEVKTLGYSRLSKEQKQFMSYAASIGCRCYIAMESKQEGELYYLKEFEG